MGSADLSCSPAVRAEARAPDFLIIGAPKCGTTWLTRRLAQHPGVCLPQDEIHFFSRHWERGWEWYLARFECAAPDQRIGENSNSYLTDGNSLTRIEQRLPHAKFIAILRHPVDRAYSSYGMQIDRGRANADIDLYLDPVRSPRPHILTNGLYAKMLAPYFDAFGRESIHITFFEDIISDPASAYRSVLAFLGVDLGFLPSKLTDRENARKPSGVPGPVKRALWWLRPQLENSRLRNIRYGAFGKFAERMISRNKSYPPLSAALAARLREYYSADISRLEDMLGRPTPGWK